MKYYLLILVSLISTTGLSSEGLVGLGMASMPTYLGSSEKETRPIGIFNYDNDRFFVEIEGPEILSNYKFSDKFSLGPIISFDFGRDPLGNKLQTELSFSYDLGLASQVVLPNLGLSDEDEFTFRIMSQFNSESVNAQTYRAGFQYFLKILFLLRTEFEFEYKYSNANYLDHFYGVSPEISNSTTIRSYRPKAGTESLNFAQNIILSFSENYGILFRWTYSKFKKEAANSPYIQDFGKDRNRFLGMAVFYRWD